VHSDPNAIYYTEFALTLLRTVELLIGTFIAWRLGGILRRRSSGNGMLTGLVYGVGYMFVAISVVETGFALSGPLRGAWLMLLTLGLFATSNALAGGAVWAAWRKQTPDSQPSNKR